MTMQSLFAEPAAAPRIPLRPYQLEALSAVEAAYGRGVHRQLIQLPTGTGKTVVFSELVRRRQRRSVILAHRDELIQQAADKLSMVAPELTVGVIKAERNDTWAPTLVASVQTLSRPTRLAQLRQHYGVVVVDEAHHAAAESYRRVLDQLVAPDTLLLGVSATLDRADGAGLGGLFEEIVYTKDILEMIEAGYLSDIRALQVHLEADFTKLHSRAGDLIDQEVADMLEQAKAPRTAVKAYLDHCPGRKGIVFTPTVKSAQDFAEAFNDAGVPAGVVSGEQPTDERREVLARLKSGALRIVCNCAVLTEGFDEPSVDLVVIARPTKSRALYVQMIGRGTRLFPGKDDLLVLDLVGSTTRHDLMTTAVLFDLDPEKLERKPAAEAKAEQLQEQELIDRRAIEEAKKAAAEGRIVSKTVELFKQRELHWSVGKDVYSLSIGSGRMVVVEQDHTQAWNVRVVSDEGVEQLAQGLDLGYAQGLAEDVAKKSGAKALIDPAAKWRDKPPTEKQLNTLRWLGLPRAHIKTAGEASDAISAAMAAGKRGYRR